MYGIFEWISPAAVFDVNCRALETHYKHNLSKKSLNNVLLIFFFLFLDQILANIFRKHDSIISNLLIIF